jgi:triosephosphate isomerase (TIM)
MLFTQMKEFFMVLATRPTVITGNWKMYKTIEEAIAFVDGLLPNLPIENMQVGVAVPFTMIYPLAQKVKEAPLAIGAQNMNDASEGAFTGEVAAKMLVNAGAKFVLLGHSERRRLYGENNEFINRKLKRAVTTGLQPFLCIGETQEEHDSGAAHSTLETQLKECLSGLTADQLKNLVIAYEPVWAIGSLQSATPEYAQEIHLFCRGLLAQLYSSELANSIVIQYGGSVNPSNAPEFLKQADIDGLLIGGASLSLESFTKIVHDVAHEIKSS